MDWKLTDDRPIFQQLYEQLSIRIVSGFYPPGGRMPTVRELAAEASVNPNTMQRALTQLEINGLAESNRTSGRSVTTDLQLIDNVRNSLALQAAQTYLLSVSSLGFSTAQAIALLENLKGENNG